MLILYEWLNLLSINKWNIPSNAIQDVYIYIHMCGKVEPSIEWDLKLYSMRYYFRVVLISNRIEDMTLYNQLDKIDQCF